MKPKFLLIIITLIVFGCNDSGKVEKIITKWDEAGTQIKEEFHVSNKRKMIKNGFYKSYYKDGQMESEGNYTDDKQHGSWKYYYENGQLQSTGTFNSDIPTGIWKEYDEDGNLVSENKY